MMEQMYFCWHEGQTEGDAREIKAASPREAAEMAVDVYQSETFHQLGQDMVTVYVKDLEDNVKVFHLNRRTDFGTPEVFS